MRTFFLFVTLLISYSLFSQEVTNLSDVEPEEGFDNIIVKKLDTDSNSTSFVIWVKKSVKSHKHETHSEIIHVVEGEGIMTIDNKSFKIKAGDYFRIPENTFHALKVTSKEVMKVLSVQSPEFLGKDRIFENQ